MENATKAMLIAAGVLIGIMILSLAVALFSELQAYVDTTYEKIEANKKNAFNTQFTNYINYYGGDKSFDLTIQDVVTAANLAYENNQSYDAQYGDAFYVRVNLKGAPLEEDINEKVAQLLKDNIGTLYKCRSVDDVKYNESTGLITEINFWVD